MAGECRIVGIIGEHGDPPEVGGRPPPPPTPRLKYAVDEYVAPGEAQNHEILAWLGEHGVASLLAFDILIDEWAGEPPRGLVPAPPGGFLGVRAGEGRAGLRRHAEGREGAAAVRACGGRGGPAAPG